jgi:hypothetical protein
LPHVDPHVTWVRRLSGQGLFPLPSRILQLWISLSLILTILPSTVAAQAFRSRLAVDPVPQARVNLRTIKLPIVDGTDLRFARTSMADGLSQTKAGQIVQDDQGFMWFATQYGLNRFDGYNFKIFVHDPGNPSSGPWSAPGVTLVNDILPPIWRTGLSYEQTSFPLAFSALSYFTPATNRYRYKLETLVSDDVCSATFTFAIDVL